MKIGCYGYDAVFKSLFPPIVVEADRRGHKIIVFPHGVRGVAAMHKDEMKECDVGLIGLSSYQTQEELELLDALKKVVIIADVPSSELRPKAQTWVQAQRELPQSQRKLKALLLALEDSREAAIRFGYPPEDIYYLGPPPHWGVSYRQMTEINIVAVRAEIRKRRGEEESQPLAEGDCLVYVPGTKITVVVNAMLRGVVETCTEIFSERFVLGFVPHPGERAESPDEEVPFAAAMAERQQLLDGLFLADVAKFTNPQRYAIADLVVASGGPNETISAAYARNDRVAYYKDENTITALAASGAEGGKWFVPEFGGAYGFGPESFREAIGLVTSPEGRARTRAQQEKNFPLPETWDTAPLIVDFLETVAKEK